MNTSAAVFILARSSEDWIPLPRLPEPTAAPTKARPANQDPDSWAALELVPCGLCGGRGRMLAGVRPCHACPSLTKPGKDRAPGWLAMRSKRAAHGCLPCTGCEGAGWRERREGETPVDPYTLERLDLQGERVVERSIADQLRTGDLRYSEQRALDDAIDKTARLIAMYDGSRDDLEQFGWERLKDLYWRHGDYRLLARAQALLAVGRPMRWTTWRRFVIGQDDHGVRSDRIRESLAETAGLMGAWMIAERRAQLNGLALKRPREVELRVPPWLSPQLDAEVRKGSLWQGKTAAHHAARAGRDALILAMRDAHTEAEIAGRFALTERRVRQILALGGASATGPAA